MQRTTKIALVCAVAICAAGISSAVAQDTQPNVLLARDLVASASAFETYTRTAAAIDAGFTGPRDVASAVHIAASHDPRQLEAGMIAYAAMAALQDPAFVSSLQRLTPDPRQREALVRRLAENPDFALELPGAESAAVRARSALLRQIEPLLATGRRVKQAAYDVQRKDWSRSRVVDPQERLAMVKQLSAQPFSPSETDATRLFQAVSAQVDTRAAAAPSRVVVKGLALAALALAGRTGDDRDPLLETLLSDERSQSCMHMAKLNLFQCMAVAVPHYEDIFCISEHAMLEAGQCMASAAGPDAPLQSLRTAEAESSPVRDGR
jgi:hypothetical protein